MALGIYISVPFCRTKCSYCNFASGVFSRPLFTKYVDRLRDDIASSEKTASEMRAGFEACVDSVYLGGGTPSVLAASDLLRIFEAVRAKFKIASDAEVTVECAPGTLSDEIVDTLLHCGVNRVSLGVQSFVDEETRAVGRLHTRRTTLDDIARLRSAGIQNINVDLIAGLPYQTAESWEYSLNEVIATGVPHCSVYMLEIDEDSRLGRELIAGGTRYHAHFVPDEDVTADFYVRAVERLNAAGLRQYEISNFAREGCESRHNLKYWTRQPYLGFGVDAHSMLKAVDAAAIESVRFSTPDSIEDYLTTPQLTRTLISRCGAREEKFFLGLRMNRGVDLEQIEARYGLPKEIRDSVAELIELGLLVREGSAIRLTDRGRLLSNEVFQRFITV